MPIHVSWHDDDHTLILFEFVGVYTWDEVYDAVRREFALMDTVDHTVRIIFDASRTVTLPAGMLPNLRSILAQIHPNEGDKIVVSTSSLVRLMFEAVGKIQPSLTHDYHFVRTRDDAYRLLGITPEQE